MKCPYRKQTVHTERMYEFPADEELYMDCYEDECPFWGAIRMVCDVDDGLYHEIETGCRRAKKEWNRE